MKNWKVLRCGDSYANSGRHTAGGGAGMMEALVCHPLGMPSLTQARKAARTQLSPPNRHDQGAHAALAASASTRRMSLSNPPTSRPKLTNKTRTGTPSRLHQDRRRNRQARDAARAVQRARRGAHGHRAQDGHPLHELRVVQAATGERGRDGERAEHVSG